MCCFFSPHLNFEPLNKSLTYEQLYHDLVTDALNGKLNGLDMVLDAEQFNYAYYQADAAGFLISLHHHTDKPMIQFRSQLVNSGIATEINLKPKITYTTADAISSLYPKERACYAPGLSCIIIQSDLHISNY